MKSLAAGFIFFTVPIPAACDRVVCFPRASGQASHRLNLAHWKGLGLALDQIATRAEGHPSRTLSGKLVARRFGTFATLSTRYGRGPEARQTCAAEAFKLGGRTLRVFASDEEIAKVRDNHESIGAEIFADLIGTGSVPRFVIMSRSGAGPFSERPLALGWRHRDRNSGKASTRDARLFRIRAGA